MRPLGANQAPVHRQRAAVQRDGTHMPVVLHVNGQLAVANCRGIAHASPCCSAVVCWLCRPAYAPCQAVTTVTADGASPVCISTSDGDTLECWPLASTVTRTGMSNVSPPTVTVTSAGYAPGLMPLGLAVRVSEALAPAFSVPVAGPSVTQGRLDVACQMTGVSLVLVMLTFPVALEPAATAMGTVAGCALSGNNAGLV